MIKKVLVYSVLVLFGLVNLGGCNQNKVVNKTQANVEKPSNVTKPEIKAPEITYNGEWQITTRLRYIQGTIISLKQSSDGPYILNLKVEFNYHSGTDPVDSSDYPFKIGEVVEFTLKDSPKSNLSNNKKIIIYQGQITTDGKNNFLGADIKYYEEKGKYFDMNGNGINLPPQDYPGSL